MIAKGRSAILFSAIAIMLGTLCGFSKETSQPKSQPKLKQAERGKIVRKNNLSGSYIVRKGDSLLRIASDYGITVKALKLANNLKSNSIQVGQKLQIPELLEDSAQIAESKQLKSYPTLNAMPQSQISQEAAIEDNDSEDQSVRSRLVQAGFQFLGVRYRLGSISEQSGIDCSGLVKSVFSKFNIELPRTSREQYQQGEKVDRNDLQKGDLVFFSSGGKRPTHVGIYVGDNKFLHAAQKAKRVIVSDLNKIWYSMRYIGARRIIWGDDDPAPEPE
jgi:peptidoglycan DL-endopeptidase LytE